MMHRSRLSAAARVIARVEIVLVTLSALAVFAIMMIVVVDVTLRYVFNAPLSWSFDLISSYLMGAAFFLALSETLRRDHHVNVDILYQHYPLRVRRVCKAFAWTLTSVLFAVMTWLAAKTCVERFLNNDVIAGAIAWPTWIPAAIGAVGLGLMTARLVVGSLALVLASISGGRIDPAIAGHDVALPQEAL